MEPTHVTVAELAQIILGSEQAEAAMAQELKNEGYRIVEDWASRPALAFKDAKKKVGDHVQRQRAAQAEYERGQALRSAVHNAQLDRERLLAAEYTRHHQTNGNIADAEAAAIAAVLEAEKDLPREVRKQLTWGYGSFGGWKALAGTMN